MLLNMDGDYEEWGVGAVVQIDPGAADGLSLRLNPSYGQAGSGVENLWANGMTARGMDSGRAKLAVHTEYKSGLNPAPYVRAELFGPGRGLWLGTRVRWMALEGTYDRNGPAISAKGVLQW